MLLQNSSAFATVCTPSITDLFGSLICVRKREFKNRPSLGLLTTFSAFKVDLSKYNYFYKPSCFVFSTFYQAATVGLNLFARTFTIVCLQYQNPELFNCDMGLAKCYCGIIKVHKRAPALLVCGSNHYRTRSWK